MILSAKILEFHVRFYILVPYVNENYERLGVPFSSVELLNEHWENWEAAYKNYINPNKQPTSDINIWYETCFDFLSKLRIRIKGNLNIKFNGADKEFLQLNTNTKSVGKIPVTDFAPSLACILQSHLMARFFAFDPKHPNKKKKPPGAANIGVKIAFVNPGELPPKPEDYRKIQFERKSIFEITYPAELAQKLMCIIVYYISPTGEVSKKESQPVVIKLF